MEFDLSPELLDLRARARAFVERESIPNERELSRTHQLAPEMRAQLEAAARDAGLWNVNTPAEFGGPGY